MRASCFGTPFLFHSQNLKEKGGTYPESAQKNESMRRVLRAYCRCPLTYLCTNLQKETKRKKHTTLSLKKYKNKSH